MRKVNVMFLVKFTFEEDVSHLYQHFLSLWNDSSIKSSVIQLALTHLENVTLKDATTDAPVSFHDIANELVKKEKHTKLLNRPKQDSVEDKQQHFAAKKKSKEEQQEA